MLRCHVCPNVICLNLNMTIACTKQILHFDFTNGCIWGHCFLLCFLAVYIVFVMITNIAYLANVNIYCRFLSTARGHSPMFDFALWLSSLLSVSSYWTFRLPQQTRNSEVYRVPSEECMHTIWGVKYRNTLLLVYSSLLGFFLSPTSALCLQQPSR